MNPLKTMAIANFLNCKTHEDLAKLYNPEMEVQVNVSQLNGTIIKQEFRNKEWSAYTDGVQVWKPFRIPYNASTTPTYEDKPLSYDLAIYAEGIGMTGWNWVKRVSTHVAFDFDAMVGHSEKHSKKLNESELQEIENVVSNIPWITLRLSTSGKGRHIYVHLDSVPTENHNEHAALARAILSMLSGITGFDFASKVDICGGNMWVWHKKMIGTEGLKLIKQGTILTDIPPNWREHVRVVSKQSKKTLPQFIDHIDTTNPEQLFQELTGQRTRVSLDDTHKKLIQYLMDHRARWWWDNDHWMLVTHTSHLLEASRALNMKGVFQTLATGSNYGNDHNCFMFPIRNGAWTVRRFSEGTKEADTWEQDGRRWTKCVLNKDLDLKTLAKLNDGIEHEKGGFVFNEAYKVVNCLSKLGVDIILPEKYRCQRTTITKGKTEGKIVVKIDSLPNARYDDLDGWLFEKNSFSKVFTLYSEGGNDAEQLENYDDLIRHLIGHDNSDLGWIIKSDNQWREEPLTHVRSVLRSMNINSRDVERIIGASVLKAWKVVNKPFQPEYPGDREWNRHAAQLRYAPNPNSDNLQYPTFNKILDHCGAGLDNDIKNNPWCINNGIQTGADYLRLWLASLFKYPSEPLPYLAFWSTEQNTGKSIFHEMLTEILLLRGYMMADKALTNESGFNGELENAILCVIEETNLGKNKGDVYNRIKTWVTSPQILHHKKHITPYMVHNHLHFIQTTNNRSEIPIFPGDTRLTIISVSQIPAEQLIPKPDLFRLLHKEAPDFLRAILSIEIPKSNDRLHIPVIETADKRDAAELNMSEVEKFIRDNCYEVPGAYILFSQFYERFIAKLDASERQFWTKRKVGDAMPIRFPKGRRTVDANVHYGNITFDPDAKPTFKLYRAVDGFLRDYE